MMILGSQATYPMNAGFIGVSECCGPQNCSFARTRPHQCSQTQGPQLIPEVQADQLFVVVRELRWPSTRKSLKSIDIRLKIRLLTPWMSRKEYLIPKDSLGGIEWVQADA
jgi:hypothetical protein